MLILHLADDVLHTRYQEDMSSDLRQQHLKDIVGVTVPAGAQSNYSCRKNRSTPYPTFQYEYVESETNLKRAFDILFSAMQNEGDL